ncbi:MAG: hypothetical protein ACOCUF_03125 [Patescibacteria group bacterium]
MRIIFTKIDQDNLPADAKKRIQALAGRFKLRKSSYAEVWEEKGVVYISTSYGLLRTDLDLLNAQIHKGNPARPHPGNNASGHWLPASSVGS